MKLKLNELIQTDTWAVPATHRYFVVIRIYRPNKWHKTYTYDLRELGGCLGKGDIKPWEITVTEPQLKKYKWKRVPKLKARILLNED